MNPVPPWDEWAQRAFPAMTKDERRARLRTTAAREAARRSTSASRTYPAYVATTQALSEGWPEGRFTQAGSGQAVLE
jgi:hypothetical protein